MGLLRCSSTSREENILVRYGGEDLWIYPKNDDLQLDEDAVTDEDELDSQDSLAWLDQPKLVNHKESGSSKQVGKQHQQDVDQTTQSKNQDTEEEIVGDIEETTCEKEVQQLVGGGAGVFLDQSPQDTLRTLAQKKKIR